MCRLYGKGWKTVRGWFSPGLLEARWHSRSFLDPETYCKRWTCHWISQSKILHSFHHHGQTSILTATLTCRHWFLWHKNRMYASTAWVRFREQKQHYVRYPEQFSWWKQFQYRNVLLGGCGYRSWLPSISFAGCTGGDSTIKLRGKNEGIRILAKDSTNIRTANNKKGSKDDAIRHLSLKAKLREVEDGNFLMTMSSIRKPEHCSRNAVLAQICYFANATSRGRRKLIQYMSLFGATDLTKWRLVSSGKACLISCSTLYIIYK